MVYHGSVVIGWIFDLVLQGFVFGECSIEIFCFCWSHCLPLVVLFLVGEVCTRSL